MSTLTQFNKLADQWRRDKEDSIGCLPFYIACFFETFQSYRRQFNEVTDDMIEMLLPIYKTIPFYQTVCNYRPRGWTKNHNEEYINIMRYRAPAYDDAHFLTEEFWEDGGGVCYGNFGLVANKGVPFPKDIFTLIEFNSTGRALPTLKPTAKTKMKGEWA